MEATLIKRTVTTSAPRERVWKAITNPKNLSKWMIQTEFKALEVDEPISFTHDGTTTYGSIAVVEPIDRFAYRWQAHQEHPAQSLVTFTLEAIPDGTRITVVEEGFDALPEPLRTNQVKDNTQGWEEVMNNAVKDLNAGTEES
jgi:uncharacterized protein YndB with AHSA1/START domain